MGGGCVGANPRSASGAVAAGDSRSRSPADQSASAVDGPARVPPCEPRGARSTTRSRTSSGPSASDGTKDAPRVRGRGAERAAGLVVDIDSGERRRQAVERERAARATGVEHQPVLASRDRRDDVRLRRARLVGVVAKLDRDHVARCDGRPRARSVEARSRRAASTGPGVERCAAKVRVPASAVSGSAQNGARTH